MTSAADGSRNAGFTLLEALVATVLMGFILAALATVTGQWVPSWNRGLAGLQRTQLAAEGLDRLTDDLAEAEFITAGPANSPPLFDGSELSVIFARATLAPNGGPGIEVVRLAETERALDVSKISTGLRVDLTGYKVTGLHPSDGRHPKRMRKWITVAGP